MQTKFNKIDYILLLIYFSISITMNIFGYYDRDALMREYLVDFPSYLSTTILLIYVFMYWLIPEFIIKKKKYFHFIFWSLALMTVLGLFNKYLGFWSGDNDWSKFPKSFPLIVEVIGISANNMGLPFGLVLTSKFYESQIRIVDIQKKQKENELKLLRSQLNPHFLFNNLNTLDALIDSNPIKAKEYINRLSLIYRYLIQTKDSEVMELSEELDLGKNYIFLMETRFGKDYDFTIKQTTDITDKFIPTGALQTLLENVVKHNKAHNTPIITTVSVKEDWLIIKNTKSKPKPNQESLGTGIENLRSRYQLLSNRNIQIEETPSQYKITIPIIKLA